MAHMRIELGQLADSQKIAQMREAIAMSNEDDGKKIDRLHSLERDTMALKMKVDAQHEKLELLINRVQKLEQGVKGEE
jgi:hypothetical protein